MNKFFLFIVGFLFCSGSISAQNIKGKYSSRSGDEGALYFIHPLDGYKGLNISSKLVYDVTYLSYKDSVTYNFTFENKFVHLIDSVQFSLESKKISVPSEILFMEPDKKNNWIYRISSKIEKTDFHELYQSEQPYRISIFTFGKELIFEIKEKDWQKQSVIVNKILTIIKYN